MNMEKTLAGIGAGVLNARKRAGVHGVVAADGMEYCAVCGEPLMLALTFSGAIAESLGTTRYVPRNCQCMRDMFAAEDEAREKEKQAEEIRRRKRECLLYNKYRESTFAVDDGRNPKIRNMCNGYVSKPMEILNQNLGLAFIGTNGTGKTFWASCIANALLDAGATVLMTTLKQLIYDMTANYGENRESTIRKIQTVQFLILDDFGAERSGEFTQEQVYEIIDIRYSAEKPLIITSNLTRDALENPVGEYQTKIYTRVIEMCPAIVEINGQRRKGIAEEKRKALANLIVGK